MPRRLVGWLDPRRRPESYLWACAVVAVGVLVPLLTFTTATWWPTLALPPAAAAAAWRGARRARQREQAVRHAQARADAIAVHDELTECVNLAGLQLFGNHLLEAARRRGDALHAFVVDVDRLGAVNAALGRGAGDEVLVAVADAVRTSTRGTDVVARLRADEFVVVGPGCGVVPNELERRVRAELVETPPAPLDVWPCRVSVGGAVLQPWDSDDLGDLVARAYQDLQVRTAMRSPSVPEPPLPAAG